MKKLIKDTLCKFGLLFFLMMFSFSGRAQVAGGQYTINIASATATTNTIDVDLTVSVTNPAAGMRFGGFSTSINFNTAIINGGTISAAYVSGRSASLSALAPNAINVATAGSIRLLTSSLSAASGVDMAQNSVLRLGIYRITNTASWGAGNASLWLQNLLVSGKTNSAVIGYPIGVTSGGAFTYTTTAPASPPGIILGFTQALPFSLPVGTVCPTSGASSNLVAVTPCANATNGSATITMSPTPTATTGTYTLDGGGSIATGTLTGGAFTISGLAAGNHNVVVTVTGCSAITVPSFTIGGTALTTTGSESQSVCGTSYTWPVSGATYNSSGTYTHVVGCNTATLTLTLTAPTTTGSESQSVCGSSYTWPVSGATYNSSGTYTHVVGCNTDR